VLKSVRPVAKRMTDMPLPGDNVFGAVKDLFDELEGMAPLLKDPRRSSIRIVLNPERMVINESQRLYTYLNLFGFPVDAVIANRVLPPAARSEYFDRWFEAQAGYLVEARQSFEPLPFFQARLFDREMVGVPLLDELAREVFGERDPSEVFFEERPIEVQKEGKGYAMYIRLPFAEKDRIQVWTKGEELVVSVDNQRRHILLPRSLASRRLLGAAFRGQRLVVQFGEKERHAD
jgi:arsenite-transporting ATPase